MSTRLRFFFVVISEIEYSFSAFAESIVLSESTLATEIALYLRSCRWPAWIGRQSATNINTAGQPVFPFNPCVWAALIVLYRLPIHPLGNFIVRKINRSEDYSVACYYVLVKSSIVSWMEKFCVVLWCFGLLYACLLVSYNTYSISSL